MNFSFLELPSCPQGTRASLGGGGRGGVAENDPEALVVTGESQS